MFARREVKYKLANGYVELMNNPSKYRGERKLTKSDKNLLPGS